MKNKKTHTARVKSENWSFNWAFRVSMDAYRYCLKRDDLSGAVEWYKRAIESMQADQKFAADFFSAAAEWLDGSQTHLVELTQLLQTSQDLVVSLT